MPRYALSQTDLLRLVVLATGVDTAKPDEAMAILRNAEYLSDTPAAKPEDPADLAPAPLPLPVKDPLTLRTWTPKSDTPVTRTDAPQSEAEQGDAPQAFQPAKPE